MLGQTLVGSPSRPAPQRFDRGSKGALVHLARVVDPSAHQEDRCRVGDHHGADRDHRLQSLSAPWRRGLQWPGLTLRVDGTDSRAAVRIARFGRCDSSRFRARGGRGIRSRGPACDGLLGGPGQNSPQFRLTRGTDPCDLRPVGRDFPKGDCRCSQANGRRARVWLHCRS